ncbi:hypothetical protein [Bradyrhizobium sp. AUGA SZCCT0042]|uniref:hypothetical protein n=1 Tax=Bradyrhizobium sp. AUGA SZCCT0042 TaxID=2807651 RepID=UPI001BACBF8A|nr:hypothetical protein [Bradyrhizobium sp. AUGA SZCCT0042]MBR1296619.1 hypothetical protein [Bradyrhizobium sp. AUGA SZCCT0042]
MMISIYNSGQLFETRECALVSLPDGREGAIWRGLAYPLELPDQRIEMGGEAFSPDDCLHPGVRTQPSRANFAIIEGVEEAYVLVSGPSLSCETASGALKASGYDVIRTGRYLGDPVDGLEADWFIRISKPNDELETLSLLLAEVLTGRATVLHGHQTLGEYRARLIAGELASAKAREAALRAEVARLKLELTSGGQTQTEIVELKAAIELERNLRQEAELAAFAAAQLANETRVDRPVAPPGRLKNEIEVVLDTLLPGVRLMRDSLLVIAAEFSNRRALYRGLAELQTVNGRLPPTWKKLKGLGDWWERHMSDGQDDAGRVYARLGESDRTWDVLISHKSEQSRDIAWLGRQ